MCSIYIYIYIWVCTITQILIQTKSETPTYHQIRLFSGNIAQSAYQHAWTKFMVGASRVKAMYNLLDFRRVCFSS